MDSIRAFMLGELNRNNPIRVFDWDKAARLIRERKPKRVEAGLQSDWEWTGGEIYRDGKIIENSYTYLASVWAIPEISLDGEVIECWTWSVQSGWDADTKWPESARAILLGEDK